MIYWRTVNSSYQVLTEANKSLSRHLVGQSTQYDYGKFQTIDSLASAFQTAISYLKKNAHHFYDLSFFFLFSVRIKCKKRKRKFEAIFPAKN